jgi:hypothetical protein
MAHLEPLVYANGVPLPWMSEYNPESAVFVDAARNATGVMIGGIIREHVSKVEVKWRWLPIEEWAKVCQIPFKSTVKFFDQETGAWSTKELYKSDPTASGKVMDHRTGRLKGWFDCRVAFIQV